MRSLLIIIAVLVILLGMIKLMERPVIVLPEPEAGTIYILQPDSIRTDSVTTTAVESVGQIDSFNSFKDRSGKYKTDYDLWFRKYSKHFFGYDFDWRRLKAQGISESVLNPKAQSHCKAQGIMQILPGTHRDIIKKYPWIENNIFSPRWNIAAGIAYDRQMWDYWEGIIKEEQDHLKFMFGSYNAGYGNIRYVVGLLRDQYILIDWENVIAYGKQQTDKRWRVKETDDYVRRVFEVHKVLSSE